MTFHAPRLAKEQLLTPHFRRIRLLGIDFPMPLDLRYNTRRNATRSVFSDGAN